MRKLSVRMVAVAVSAALAGGVVASLTPAAAAVPGRGSAPADRAARSGPVAVALAAARRLGRRVEVVSLRTDTSQVFANPSGTATLVEHAQPVRTRSGGSWKAIDTRLHALPGGRVGPAAAAGDLSLSGGGTGPLARLNDGSRSVAVSWPWRLPGPVLSGATATYRGVLPGVDLRARATTDGFTEVLVVHDRAAAADPRLSAIRLAMTASGGSVRKSAGGGLSVVAPGGKTVFSAPQPVMWDSGRGARPVAMGERVGDGGVTVVPDQAMLTSRATRFPVYIDPTVSLGLASWGNVVNTAPNQTMAQDPFPGDGAKAGYTCDSNGCYVYRSGFAFGLGGLYGTHILSATFGITLLHSWDCTATPTQLRLTSAVTRGSTWNNLAIGAVLDTKSASSNCGQGQPFMVFSGGLAGQVQTGANSGWPTISVGLLAPNESTTDDYKRFSANPTLSVVYNSIPSAPDTLTVDGKSCVTGANRPYVADLTPTLTARVSDPDPGQLLGIRFSGAPLGGSLTSWVSQDNLANGGTANIKIPAGILADRGVYTFQAYVTDSTDNSGWSAPCEFGVEVTPPDPVKQITSTDYPNDGSFHGMQGVTGTFTLTPPDVRPEDVSDYLVGLNKCNQPTCARDVPADPATHGATVGITPDLAGPNTLNVWTKNKAGLLSSATQPVTYNFNVRSPAGPAADYPMNDGPGQTTADATGHGNTAMLTGGTPWTGLPCTVSGLVGCDDLGRRGAGGAISFDGSTGYAATSGPLKTTDPNNPSQQVTVRTDQSYTVSAWVDPASVSPTPSGFLPTAVSADGVHASAFFLRHTFAPNPVWLFTVVQSDSDAAALVNLFGHIPVQPGVWTHVAGSYDAATDTIKLYVNGVLDAQTTIPGTFNATGGLVIGRAKWNSALNHFWPGKIDDVRFDARLLTDSEVAAQANTPVMTGDWELGERTNKWAHDTSRAEPPADGELSGGTSWVPVDPGDARPDDGGLPNGPTALNFDGSAGAVTAPALGQGPFPNPVRVWNPFASVFDGQLHLTAENPDTGHVLQSLCGYCDGTDRGAEDLGGSIGGTPVAQVYNNQFHVFATGSDGTTLYTKYYNGSSWSAWQTVATGVVDPTATVYAGQLHVVARSTATNHLMHYLCVKCDGTDWANEDQGGSISGTPVAQVYNNQFHVFATGSDGTTLYTKYYDGSSWSAWQIVTTGAADPSVAVFNGQLHVIARDTATAKILHYLCVKCDGTDWTSENLQGSGSGAPLVVVYNNQFHVITEGSDGTTLYTKYWATGAGWSAWQIIAPGATQPSAVVYNNQLHVVAHVVDTGREAHFSCVTCDGTDWNTEATPVVNTSQSFTVAAWVRLTSTNGWHTAVSMDARPWSAFALEYAANSGRWEFEMAQANSGTSSLQADWAGASSPPAVGTWTHLAGVFDAQTHTIKLYVDGVLAGTASHTSTLTSVGQLRIGEAENAGGVMANQWAGDIASVQVYSGVLSDQQIANLAGV